MIGICDDLRKSVLQAAIQGRLTQQLPEDGDAETLYAEIQKEKQKLIKEGKIKKEKLLSEITDDDIPFDIPENWKWIRLSNIAIGENGDRSSKYPVESDYVKMGIPFFGSKDMVDNNMSFDDVRYISQEKFNELGNGKLKNKDIICLLRGSVGKTALFKETTEFSTGFICAQMMIVRCLSESFVDYVFLCMKTPEFADQVREKTTGTAVRQLPAKDVMQMIIPLPPLAEQKRIVARVDELMKRIDEMEKTEKDIIALYDAFPGDMKASLLQSAIQGKLTEQLASDVDAEMLYQEIQAEKQRLIKEGKIKKEKPLPEITDDDIPFDIPENWKWVRLGTLLKFVSDGTHKTPTYVSNGIPFLSVQNISKGYFDFSKIKYIPEREHEELTKRCLPQRNDILVCRIGTLGKAIKVTLDFEFSIFVSLGLLRSVSEEIVDWIIFIINSPYGNEWIDSVKVGGGTHTNKINLNSFPDMLIPLPPLAEQKRIVEKLDKLLPLCDSIKEAIDATA